MPILGRRDLTYKKYESNESIIIVIIRREYYYCYLYFPTSTDFIFFLIFSLKKTPNCK